MRLVYFGKRVVDIMNENRKSELLNTKEFHMHLFMALSYVIGGIYTLIVFQYMMPIALMRWLPVWFIVYGLYIAIFRIVVPLFRAR